MITLNKCVAVEPIVIDANKGNAPARGLDLSDKLVTKLVATKVIFDSENFKASGLVYFRTDIVNQPSARQKFDLDGQTFVLIPESMVILYSHPHEGYEKSPDEEAQP